MIGHPSSCRAMELTVPAEEHSEWHERKDLLPDVDPMALPTVAYERDQKAFENTRTRRNFLQRKRMHAKDDAIQSMRETVKALEQRYERICLWQDHDHTCDANQEEIAPKQELRARGQAHGLYTLVKEMHRLIRENESLRALVERHVYYQYTLPTTFEDLVLDPSMVSAMEIAQMGKFFYIPFTTDDCYGIIREDLAERVAKKPDFVDPTINRELPFGWVGCIETVQYENTNWMQARSHMTKIWPGTPETHCDTLWKFIIMEINPGNVFLEQHQLVILQHVSEDIKIMRRRVMWQGWTTWSVFMAYRMRLNESYLIGVVPLPLWGNGNTKGVSESHAKLFLDARETLEICNLHHLFVPVDTNKHPHQKAQTRLYRWGLATCDQPMFMPLFEEGAIENLLRYERLIVFPPVKNLIQTNA